jgi:hypothetical protein
MIHTSLAMDPTLNEEYDDPIYRPNEKTKDICTLCL